MEHLNKWGVYNKKNMKNLPLKNIKILIVFIFSMNFTLSCKGQIKEQSSSLSAIFIRCHKSSSFECSNQFFNTFPNNFSEFLGIYGYSVKTGAAPNYETSKDQIDYFFKISTQIKAETFSNKIINICVGGIWDADAVNYFQVGAQDYFCKNPDIILKLISKLKMSQNEKFWYFILDGSVFNINNYERIKKLLSNYPLQKEIFNQTAKKIRNKIQYSKVISETDIRYCNFRCSRC